MRSRRSETIKYLTPDETKRLFSVIKDKRDKAIFLIAYRHALRASEIGLLQKSDIDSKRLRITVHRLKNSYTAEHPMQADEARILKSYLRSRSDDSPVLFLSRNSIPIGRKMLHVLMRKYGALAEIPSDKQHFHVLKHSIATHLLDASDDIRFVQDWLGHSNIQNTVIYTQLVSSSRETKARKHFMKLPKF
jgi:type 1 fimbriae regulatory protein FimB